MDTKRFYRRKQGLSQLTHDSKYHMILNTVNIQNGGKQGASGCRARIRRAISRRMHFPGGRLRIQDTGGFPGKCISREISRDAGFPLKFQGELNAASGFPGAPRGFPGKSVARIPDAPRGNFGPAVPYPMWWPESRPLRLPRGPLPAFPAP